MFMARAIRGRKPIGTTGRLAQYRKVPELSEMAHVYREVFPDRLTRFQHSPGSPEQHMAKIGDELRHDTKSDAPQSDAPPNLLRHELRHEAESVFWLLVWWVVNAVPDGCTSQIPAEVWVPLVGKHADARPLAIPSSCLAPAYASLSELLNQLGEALGDDLYWATEIPYTHPEFLHEVFQRHILNFIFENQDKYFMTLAKANHYRSPSIVTMTSSLSATQIEFVRTCSANTKHSRKSEPEAEIVSCYSILI